MLFAAWKSLPPGLSLVKCYGLNVCVSPGLYGQILTLKVMVLGGEASGS